jgi:hypothetical protein
MTQPKHEWEPDVEQLIQFSRWAATGRTPRLNAALSKLQAEIPTFGVDEQRTVTVEHKDGGSHQYKYVTLGKVIEGVAPLMAKYGLSFRSMPGYGDPGDGKIGMVLRYTLAHESGEQVDGIFPISAGDKGIQGLGSAITYARRYCLAALLNIAVEQDDDGMAALLNEQEGSVRTRTSRAKPPAARSNRRATPAAADSLPGGDPATGQGDVPPQSMLNHMFGVLGNLAKLDGFEPSREQRLRGISDIVCREITSSKDLTRSEVQAVIDRTADDIERHEAEGGSDAG